MIKILNLLEDDVLLTLENSSFTLVESGQSIYDVVLCGLEHVDYVKNIKNHEELFLIVALDNLLSNKALIPNTFHAWINRNSLERLPEMIRIHTGTIEKKKATRESRTLMERFVVDTSVHHKNLDGIKKSMRESAQEIENIFEARVEEMRCIHADTGSTFENLSRLKAETAPAVFNDLKLSWEMTQSILQRTDDIIKAMFGFITVLQCEDRISQMIDGIQNIMLNDIQSASASGYTVSLADEITLKKRLASFYTIQDQRDYVMGDKETIDGCKPESIDIDDFILF